MIWLLIGISSKPPNLRISYLAKDWDYQKQEKVFIVWARLVRLILTQQPKVFEVNFSLREIERNFSIKIRNFKLCKKSI